MQPRCTSKVSQVSDCQDVKLIMAKTHASYAGGKNECSVARLFALHQCFEVSSFQGYVVQ